MSSSNVTDSYSYNWRIGFIDIASDQIYIQQGGIIENWVKKNFLILWIKGC